MKLAKFFAIWLGVPVIACSILGNRFPEIPLDFLSIGFSLVTIQIFSLIYRITHND